MDINKQTWDPIQSHFAYTDEEMTIFKENQRNVDVLSKAPALMNKTIVVEVVQSHGCNSQHKKGDKLYLDGAGNFISKLCPKRMCAFIDHS